MNPTRTIIVISSLASALAVACGGGSSKSATPTNPPSGAVATTAAATAPTTAAKLATPSVTAAAKTAIATPASASTAAPVSTAVSDGKTYNETQAATLLGDASLTPKDIEPGWTIMADVPQDNAAAATADPVAAASIERCGRLAGRLVTNQPQDVVSSYLAGTAVSYFSQLTVYKTATGAADCAAEAATRFQAPGALARAFGTVFKDPAAVKVQSVDYPPTADGSVAFALTGDIDAAGTVVQLQIVVVSFRKGNVNAVVGTATSPLTNPTVGDLGKYVNLVLQRISGNQ